MTFGDSVRLSFRGALPLLLACGFVLNAGDCTFQARRDEILNAQAKSRKALFNHVRMAMAGSTLPATSVPASQIPVRNFIDSEIFRRLAADGVRSAPLSTDEEFLRRITLDLTGRIPSPDEIRAFTASQDPDKRSQTIERLLYSPEFNDRWTLWLGDLLQNNSTATNISRGIPARNAFYEYIRAAIASERSVRDIAYEVVTSTGNNYEALTGQSNFMVGGTTPMGPSQDTYDTMLVKSATTFLGLGNYDCLFCHNGKGHLEQVNLWGAAVTRMDAWKMASFFSRVRLVRRNVATDHPYYNSYDVNNAASGSYDLNTNYGNRPTRAAQGTTKAVTPEYRGSSATPKASQDWRLAFAENMVADPMFSKNIVNRVWKQLFNQALADPVDYLDPARLDPANPPPAAWGYQTAHPVLLQTMADWFADGGFSLRTLIRAMVESSAYQLSARYGADWKLDYVPLFARHYPRRLDAEEIHDAIVKATNVKASYTIGGWSNPVNWAMQLPDTAEPRSNSAVAAFLNSFLRGDRENQPRSQAASILQNLYMMNDSFVTTRVKVSASSTLAAIGKMSSNDAAVEELFLLLLSRKPSAYERTQAVAFLAKASGAAARNTAVEDLAWAIINKTDFVFTY